MNPTNIFNLKRKKILVLVMSFIPKKRILQIIKKNKRLQKLLKISPTLYEIYSLKNVNHPFTYKLQNYGNDEFLKKELLFSLFEIANLQFFENIGFEIKNTNKDSHKKRISNIVKLPSFIDNDVLIASFSWDNSLKIWNLTKKTLQVNFTLPIDDIIIQEIPLYDKKIVADKKKPIKIMIITWDKDIIIYNLRNNEVFATRKIEQAGKLITAIRVNRLLCTSSYENEIRIWNIFFFFHCWYKVFFFYLGIRWIIIHYFSNIINRFFCLFFFINIFK
jgi:WD40 repeat protein